MISVIAAEGPVDGKHANLADFCGWTAAPFWLRPTMHTRRPVGSSRFEQSAPPHSVDGRARTAGDSRVLTCFLPVVIAKGDQSENR